MTPPPPREADGDPPGSPGHTVPPTTPPETPVSGGNTATAEGDTTPLMASASARRTTQADILDSPTVAGFIPTMTDAKKALKTAQVNTVATKEALLELFPEDEMSENQRKVHKRFENAIALTVGDHTVYKHPKTRRICSLERFTALYKMAMKAAARNEEAEHTGHELDGENFPGDEEAARLSTTLPDIEEEDTERRPAQSEQRFRTVQGGPMPQTAGVFPPPTTPLQPGGEDMRSQLNESRFQQSVNSGGPSAKSTPTNNEGGQSVFNNKEVGGKSLGAVPKTLKSAHFNPDSYLGTSNQHYRTAEDEIQANDSVSHQGDDDDLLTVISGAEAILPKVRHETNAPKITAEMATLAEAKRILHGYINDVTRKVREDLESRFSLRDDTTLNELGKWVMRRIDVQRLSIVVLSICTSQRLELNRVIQAADLDDFNLHSVRVAQTIKQFKSFGRQGSDSDIAVYIYLIKLQGLYNDIFALAANCYAASYSMNWRCEGETGSMVSATTTSQSRREAQEIRDAALTQVQSFLEKQADIQIDDALAKVSSRSYLAQIKQCHDGIDFAIVPFMKKSKERVRSYLDKVRRINTPRGHLGGQETRPAERPPGITPLPQREERDEIAERRANRGYISPRERLYADPSEFSAQAHGARDDPTVRPPLSERQAMRPPDIASSIASSHRDYGVQDPPGLTQRGPPPTRPYSQERERSSSYDQYGHNQDHGFFRDEIQESFDKVAFYGRLPPPFNILPRKTGKESQETTRINNMIREMELANSPVKPFDGAGANYFAWESQFRCYVHEANVPVTFKLHFLQRMLLKDSHAVIIPIKENHELRPENYERAIKSLVDAFGGTQRAYNHARSMLKSVKKLPLDEASNIQMIHAQVIRYCDFCDHQGLTEYKKAEGQSRDVYAQLLTYKDVELLMEFKVRHNLDGVKGSVELLKNFLKFRVTQLGEAALMLGESSKPLPKGHNLGITFKADEAKNNNSYGKTYSPYQKNKGKPNFRRVNVAQMDATEYTVAVASSASPEDDADDNNNPIQEETVDEADNEIDLQVYEDFANQDGPCVADSVCYDDQLGVFAAMGNHHLPECVLCSEKKEKFQHLLYQCPKYKAMDPKGRKGVLINHKRCFNCTGTDHNTRTCPSTRTCAQCKEKHHTSVCLKANPDGVGAYGKTNNDKKTK